MRIVLNPAASRASYSEREGLVISSELARQARHEISQWPQYAVTPLHHLSGLARQLGIAGLYYKDESERLGQGSFKTLGGAYAATLKLRDLAGSKSVTLCCATDGNHGRSVAFAARRHGCGCVVYMHENAPADKEAAIRALGARVVRVAGNYDDSVRLARKSAADEGWVLVADTSDDPLDRTTRHVIQGYGVMVLELVEQLAGLPPPTHVFLQAGVGGFAAAIAGMLAEIQGSERPVLIVVEPEAAACVMECALRGAPARIDGDLITAMAMLSSGEASPVAWPILHRRIDAFLTIEDASAVAAARQLAESDDMPLNVGVSGAAGYAGLVELLRHAEAAGTLGLNDRSRVLVFGTEQGVSRTADQ